VPSRPLPSPLRPPAHWHPRIGRLSDGLRNSFKTDFAFAIAAFAAGCPWLPAAGSKRISTLSSTHSTDFLVITKQCPFQEIAHSPAACPA